MRRLWWLSYILAQSLLALTSLRLVDLAAVNEPCCRIAIHGLAAGTVVNGAREGAASVQHHAAVSVLLYVQDRERGVVWEETIIFLQDDAKMVSTTGFCLVVNLTRDHHSSIAVGARLRLRSFMVGLIRGSGDVHLFCVLLLPCCTVLCCGPLCCAVLCCGRCSCQPRSPTPTSSVSGWHTSTSSRAMWCTRNTGRRRWSTMCAP